MKYLALAFLFIVVACGKSEPTVVPTVAMPTIGTPPPTSTSPPPTWTPEPTHTPWPSKTPTPGLVITTTGETQICDDEMLRMYIGAVAQIEAANLTLEQQEFEESAVRAAIPGLEQLLTRVNEFPTPCENALWLRQMLSFELGVEIGKLED